MRSNALKLLKTPVVNDCIIHIAPSYIWIEKSFKQKITSEVLDLIKSKVNNEYFDVLLDDNVIYIKQKKQIIYPVK